MKNETRNKTRAGARGSGDGRTGTRGSGDGRTGTGGNGARGSVAVALDERGAIMGTAPVEDRGQSGGDQRESAPDETSSKSTNPIRATTRTKAGTRTGAKSRTTTGTATASPDDSESEIPIEAQTFIVDETRPLKPSTVAKYQQLNRKKAKEQAEQTALTLLTILDGAIGMTLGPECAMTPDEHKMIDEPLARILARMAPETTELIDRWTDPLLLATGLIMWGARVFLVLSREVRRESKKNKPAMTQPESAEPSGGLDLNHPIQATGIPVEVAEALG